MPEVQHLLVLSSPERLQPVLHLSDQTVDQVLRPVVFMSHSVNFAASHLNVGRFPKAGFAQEIAV